jgi:hypothetical protein
VNIRLNWTEGEIRAAVRAIDQYGETFPQDALEPRLVLSRMRAELELAAVECHRLDVEAIRQEYGMTRKDGA